MQDIIKRLFHRLGGSWPKSGPALPRTREPEGRLFGRENLVVALSLFGLGLICFGVI